MLTSLYDSLKDVLIYLPLSLIGLWRWSYWFARRIAAQFYRPEHTHWPKDHPRPTVSVVTPVYNEDPVVFEQAMQSWIKNKVTEIVAVIDKTNTHQIVDFEKRFVARKDVKCRLVVTAKPGKRAALCDGIALAKGDIIALVDSDTIWDKNVLQKSLPHFLDRQVGGVTVGQRIQNPAALSDILFDILLWTRYREEVPFLLGVGKAFNTLSGRTAMYRREAIFNPEHDNLHDLRHEHFFGTRGVSGDDKRLTHLILEQGWNVSFALGAEVYTPGLGNMKKFLKQRLRWTRNSWRADLRAVRRGWVWRHPALAIFMIDRFVQPLFILIGPVAFAVALIARDWLTVGVLITWWFISRLIRLFSYFKAYPARLVYLPAYIVYTYVNAFIKVYAFATLLEHSWATRWHKQRLRKKTNWRKLIPLTSGGVALILFTAGIFWYVNDISAASGVRIHVPAPVQPGEFNDSLDFSSTAPLTPVLPAQYVLPTGVKTYTVKAGDSLNELSKQFNMTIQEIKKLNGLRDPDVVNVGQVLLYYDVPDVKGFL